MENWRENFSMISTFKVAEKQSAALAARLFFERALSAADFHPPGFSQKAIICIKKISAPPFKKMGERFTGGGSTLEWEIGIRGEVEKLFRRAYRPIRETVPAQAESVFFEDRAELLACLARDWQRGLLHERWWWRALLPNLFRTQTPFDIWLAAAEFIPSAVRILSTSGAAQSFVKKLKPNEAFELLRAVIRIFGLDKLKAALSEPLEKETTALAEPTGKRGAQSRFSAVDKIHIPAKSAAFFDSTISGLTFGELSFEQALLLETGLRLARSPRTARSAEFAARVKAQRVENELRKSVANGKTVRIFEKHEAPEIQINESEGSKIKPPFFDRQTGEKHDKPAEKAPDEITKAPASRREDLSEPQKNAEVLEASKIGFEPAPPKKELEKIKPAETKRDEKIIAPGVPDRPFESFFENHESGLEYDFQTRFGGVFYLLNLGLYLGLYRDFTESLTAEIDLNIWDFVALLGLEFLGERIKSDAVWEFLKGAAERENDDQFGREFDRLQDWRMPPAWLETFSANREWLWAKNGRRLVVRHADGFNVVDIVSRGDAEAQLKNELESYEDKFSRVIKAEKINRRRMKSKTWLKNLAEYLRERLFQALKLQTPEELNAVLFERPATVAVSATHLEITFGLADLPIEIRLAGIDRNPAWIPAAGKYVYFHFV